jgi:hypothetical protein
MSNQPKDQKKKVDLYLGIKNIGYKMSQLPSPYSIKDLVRVAKFTLAHRTGRLLKDPIWDEYTVEELLAEYFAHAFIESEEFKSQFERDINSSPAYVDEFADWADKQIAEEGKIRETTLGQLEDNVSFDPTDVIGEDE